MVSWYLVAWIDVKFNAERGKKKNGRGEKGVKAGWYVYERIFFFSAFLQPSAWLAFCGAKWSFSSEKEPLEIES